MLGRVARAVTGVGLCLLAGGVQIRAQFQMPDAKQMSGIPRPVDDLPNGSVSVRLVRGELSNNIANHDVELTVGGKTLTAKTDEAGRAQFDKLTPGARLKAAANVDGEHLESQEFSAPAQGGIRLLLVATDKSKGSAAVASAPAVAGSVVIGGNSRIMVALADEAIQLYYVLEVINNALTPVGPVTPFSVSTPSETIACELLEGSSPLAKVDKTSLRVDGPFPPGPTSIQAACELPISGGSLDLTMRFPAALERTAVIVKKVGAIKLASPQITTQREMPAQGEIFIAGNGPGLAAGQPLTLALTGLPHHSSLPRWIALCLAAAIVVGGVWASTRALGDSAARTAERKNLVVRRDRLFNDLVRLEHEHRSGRADERRYSTRREDLIGALEHMYGALEGDDRGPEPLDHAGLAAPLGTLGAS